MSKLTHLRQSARSREKRTTRMNRILGANGLPHGTPGPIARPGQTQCHITTGLSPAGPVLVIQVGPQTTPIPLPADMARQLGVGLISLAALHEASVAGPGQGPDAIPTAHDDLLAEAEASLKLRGLEDDEQRHDQPDDRPDGVGGRRGGEGDGEPGPAGPSA